jgi:hypothetical protein
VGIGIKQEEENHAQGHEIHVNQQEYATVIEAPAPLHATNRVDGAGKSDKTGQNEQGIWMDNGEAGDQKREAQAQKNQQNATEEGPLARVENARWHAILITSPPILCPSATLEPLERSRLQASLLERQPPPEQERPAASGPLYPRSLPRQLRSGFC